MKTKAIVLATALFMLFSQFLESNFNPRLLLDRHEQRSICKYIDLIRLRQKEKTRLALGYDMDSQEKIYVRCFMLGIKDEQWVYDVFKMESGHDPMAVNRQPEDTTAIGRPMTKFERLLIGRAAGIMQFMPGTAYALGTSNIELYFMSLYDQLDYVFKYLEFFKPEGGYKTKTDLYLAVLWPKAIGKPDDYKIGGRVTCLQNSGIDKKGNGDGQITISDVKSWLGES